MPSYIDTKYVNILSSRLSLFKRKTNGLYNFRCPFCGDSQKSKTKARGYFYQRRTDLFFRCHNCGQSSTFSNFLKQFDGETYKEYALERYKEGITGKGHNTPDPKIKYKQPFYLYSALLYAIYLYFYSPNLSLVEGETLWGNIVKFAPTDYLINLFNNFYEIQNIFYILFKSIYSINFFKFINTEKLLNNEFASSFITSNNLSDKLNSNIETYSSIDTAYLLLVTLLIFVFSYLFTKIMHKNESLNN